MKGRGLHRQLVATFLALLLIFMLLVGLVVRYYFREFYMEELSMSLAREGRFLGEIVGEKMGSGGDYTLNEFVQNAARDLKARVTVIALGGKVLADSQEAASAMENHGDRPEVQEAVNKGQGIFLRYSSTPRNGNDVRCSSCSSRRWLYSRSCPVSRAANSDRAGT